MAKLIDETVFRINKAIDYIDDNLHDKLCLKGLSDISCFPKNQFHILFHTLTGQSPSSYIKRLRMKKAITLLSKRKSLSVSEVSELCGYSTISSFSKTFSEHFGIPPAFIKDKLNIDNIKDYNEIIHTDLAESKLVENINCESISCFHSSCRELLDEEVYKKLLSADIKTEQVADIGYIYSRHFGSYKPEDIRHFTARHFDYAHEIYKLFPEIKMLGIFLDCPTFTPDEYCRYDAGIAIPDGFDELKLIGKRKITAGLYATTSLEIPLHLTKYIWYFLRTEWLSSSSYEVDYRPSFCEYTPIKGVPITEKLKVKFHLPISTID